MTRLLKIFKEYDVQIKGKGQFGRYTQLFILKPIEGQQITLEKLQDHVCILQQKYPQRGFRLKKRGKYYIIDQTLYREDGKRKQDRVPVYFNLDTQEIMVPWSYIVRKPKLVNYILLRTLGALKLAKPKYFQTLPSEGESE